jgi:hypothetical protein
VTRSTLTRTLRRVYLVLILVLGISFVARIADYVPFLAGTGAERLLKDTYEFLRDMSLLIATGGVAFIANVYQKRQSFIDALKEEWRDIIAAKSALFTYTQYERPSLDQYLATFFKLSETIDNMRSVYRNVGETGALIGLYPYAPLHDMRRALQTLDPRENPDADVEARTLVRDAILQSFYALRETFLEELDLEEPDHPLLMSGGRRIKTSGATQTALDALKRQKARQERAGAPDPRIVALLSELRTKEETTAKRQPAAQTEVPAAGTSGA